MHAKSNDTATWFDFWQQKKKKKLLLQLHNPAEQL